MLKDLPLKSVYDSSEDSLIGDLFHPLLTKAKCYRRGVGYFTSGWLKEAAKGLSSFAENGGKAYFVTSPHLEERDWDALREAQEAKQDAIVYELVRSKAVRLGKTLESDTAAALAWLVADGILTFKFAIPRNNLGDFHDKFGIFEDERGDRVAIHGSYNDSLHGLLNGESFSVFRSWVSEQDEYVQEHARRFEKLWEGANEFFRTYDMTDAIHDEIVKLRKHSPRPYGLPAALGPKGIDIPPGISLYNFQREAIDQWSKGGGRGLFEMATGTGKTFTALAAAAELQKKVGTLAVIVSVPFNHLVDQWQREAALFGFTPLLCRGNASSWTPAVRSRVQDFNLGSRKSLFLITTHKTGSGDKFTSLTRTLCGNTLYVADEAHYLGAAAYRAALLEGYNYRIGLSATPNRWFDDAGSAHLRDYFGPTVADMPLESAIGPFLTPYRFVPHLVPLTSDEMDEFDAFSAQIRALSAKLGRLSKSSKVSDDDNDRRVLERLLRERAAVVGKAENKFPMLERIMRAKSQTEGVERIRHTIVYCAPGETAVATRLLANLGLRVHEFVHTVPNEQRVRILEQFARAELQVLVAIKCLDEGVDIPATREAIFLASTSNPREFIQRRGRILRKYAGKDKAIVHDLVVVPPARTYSTQDDLEADRTLMRREMPRFAEFSSAAENEFEARDVLFPRLLELDLVHLFDLKPWDVYHQYQERGE